MDSFWLVMLLALLSSINPTNYDHINYIGGYMKYYKYGSDE